MKTKLFSLIACISLAAATAAKAGVINVPSGCFQGISTNLSFPTLSTTTYGIGAWSLQLQGTLTLGGTAKVGSAAAVGGPTPITGINELGLVLPVGVGAQAALWQNLTNVWQPNSTYTLTVALDPASTVNLLSGSTLALRAGSSNVVSVSGMALVNLVVGGGNTGFNNVTLTVKTGSTVPASGIGIYLSTPSVATVGGSLYVDNFALTQTPNMVTVSGTSSGSNLTLAGSGAAPGQQFELLTTSNLLAPSPIWAQLATPTNKFDVNGNLILTVPIDHLTPWRFFKLLLQ